MILVSLGVYTESGGGSLVAGRRTGGGGWG